MAEAEVAVIGAGLAGLTCARRARQVGLKVQVFDKARGVSGRLSLRRVPGEATGSEQQPALQFDHGAQYYTARDPRLIAQTQDWQARGIVREWTGEFVTLDQGTIGPDPGSGSVRYVGTPGMNEICRDLARDVDVTCGIRVRSLRQTQDGWELDAVDALDGRRLPVLTRFNAVVCTLPAPQAFDLLPAKVSFRPELRSLTFGPCRCVMVSFTEPIDFPFVAAFVQNSPLRWISRETTKPGRPANSDSWVLHAGPEWSRSTVDEPNEAVLPELLAAFAAALATPLPEIAHVSLHRWLYAIPENPLTVGCLFDPAVHVIAAGDWCSGARVEGAFASGLAAAAQLEEWFGQT